MTKRKSSKIELKFDDTEEPDWTALSVIPMQQTSKKKYCSSVWEYFGQLMRSTTCLDTKNFYCLPCFETRRLKQYSSTTATSNFYTHLRVFHNITPERHIIKCKSNNTKEKMLLTDITIMNNNTTDNLTDILTDSTNDPLTDILSGSQHSGRPSTKKKKILQQVSPVPPPQSSTPQSDVDNDDNETVDFETPIPSKHNLPKITTKYNLSTNRNIEIHNTTSRRPSPHHHQQQSELQVYSAVATPFRIEEAIEDEDYDKLFILSLVTEFRKVPDEYRLDAKADLLGVLRKYRYISRVDRPDYKPNSNIETPSANSQQFTSQSQNTVDY